MSGLIPDVSTVFINHYSTLANLRNNYCSTPIISSDGVYSQSEQDALTQCEEPIRDFARLALVKPLIGDTLELETQLAYFKSRGGKFVISPTIDQIRKEGMAFEIHLRPEDLVIPICHEGMNRSQIMFLVANALKSQGTDRYNVSFPHGAESGFDPYRGFSDLTEDNWYRYIHGIIFPFNPSDISDWLTKCFYQKFGVDKSKRIGQTESESAKYTLNPIGTNFCDEALAKVSSDRTNQRKIMDKLLYDSDMLKTYTGVSGRVVIFTFCRATTIFLNRLLEVSGDKDLSNIFIVCLPYPDEISRAGGEDEIYKYKETTGHNITRDALNQIRLEEVFAFYASILKLVI
jgi:hypothetical protein